MPMFGMLEILVSAIGKLLCSRYLIKITHWTRFRLEFFIMLLAYQITGWVTLFRFEAAFYICLFSNCLMGA